ncbi:transmembrane protein 223-like [Scylla paramamosain]|uniref:transmembrane protein 223-like n=1 Tax=Scylla paramamosain TaxID=85552 RepID=UPI0030838892
MATVRLLDLCRTRTLLGPLLHEATTAISRAARVPKQHLHSGAAGRGATRKDTTRLMLDNEYVVAKDTLLYKNENKGFYRMINFFGLSQFVFWTYLSHFAYTTMKSVEIPEEQKNNKALSWWKRTDFGQYRNGITLGSFIIGWGTMGICWMYTLRSVSGMVLKRGGQNLLLFTFTPLGRNRSLLVPIEKVSARQSRTASRVHLPLKVQGKAFHYLLDMKGDFTNSKLFDYSAGIRRNWAR